MKTNKKTIVRTIMLFVALINVALEMYGYNTLPIDDKLCSEYVSFVFLLWSAVSSWWNNNSFTEKAKKADEYLQKLVEEENK